MDESLLNVQKPLELSLPSGSTDIEQTENLSLDDVVELLYPEDGQTNSQVIRNVIAAWNLTPFDVQTDSTDDDQLKVTALTSTIQYKRVLDFKERGIKRLKLSTPYEKAISPADCIHINDSSTNAVFNETMKLSPYRQLLAFESYTHITEEHLELLNAHWRKRPWMFMAVSQLLAGAVLVDGNQALLLNGVESYSRYPSIDAHFEKVQPTQESSIADLTSQYPNMLKITKLYVDNSEKLVIGTKTLNILAISSIRIDDSKIAPEVGPSTKQFTPSIRTRIFLSISSIQLANDTLNSSDGKVLSVGMDALVHIRQLRSKFHQRSMFSLGRFYSVFTQDITVQPFSIYTLVNSTKNDNDCILGSKVMELIGNLAQEESDPTLLKKDVVALLPKKPQKNTQVQQDICSIVNLFKENDKLDIIGNAALCPYLKSIADTTTNGLKRANEDIIVKIWNKFRAKIQ